MKENGKTMLKQDKESKFIQINLLMKDNFGRTILLEKECSQQKKDMFTKETSKKVFALEME